MCRIDQATVKRLRSCVASRVWFFHSRHSVANSRRAGAEPTRDGFKLSSAFADSQSVVCVFARVYVCMRARVSVCARGVRACVCMMWACVTHAVCVCARVCVCVCDQWWMNL